MNSLAGQPLATPTTGGAEAEAGPRDYVVSLCLKIASEMREMAGTMGSLGKERVSLCR